MQLARSMAAPAVLLMRHFYGVGGGKNQFICQRGYSTSGTAANVPALKTKKAWKVALARLFGSFVYSRYHCIPRPVRQALLSGLDVEQ